MKTIIITLFFLLVFAMSPLSEAATIWQQDFEGFEIGALTAGVKGDPDEDFEVEYYGCGNILEVATKDGEKALKYTTPGGDVGCATMHVEHDLSGETEIWLRYWIYFESGYDIGDDLAMKLLIFSSDQAGQCWYPELYAKDTYWIPLSISQCGDEKLGSSGTCDTWQSEWYFDGDYYSDCSEGKPPGWTITTGNWYQIICHYRLETGNNKDGIHEYNIYDSDGTLRLTVESDFDGDDGGTESYPYDQVKSDYTHNWTPSSGRVQYRDDFVISDSELSFVARGGSSPTISGCTISGGAIH